MNRSLGIEYNIIQLRNSIINSNERIGQILNDRTREEIGEIRLLSSHSRTPIGSPS